MSAHLGRPCQKTPPPGEPGHDLPVEIRDALAPSLEQGECIDRYVPVVGAHLQRTATTEPRTSISLIDAAVRESLGELVEALRAWTRRMDVHRAAG